MAEAKAVQTKTTTIWVAENAAHYCIQMLNISKFDKLLSFLFGWYLENIYFCISKIDKLINKNYVREINAMNNAATSYDYCYHLCKLFEHNSKTIFFMLYGIMYYRTYSSKQYSKWSLWLFYITAIVMLVHFIAAEQVFEYVFFHIDEHKWKLPSLANDIYGTPAFFIILSFFFKLEHFLVGICRDIKEIPIV